MINRPITPLKAFEDAISKSDLSDKEQQIIECIRFLGVFNQVSLTQVLRIESKPPVLSKLCTICREIGKHIPEHFEVVRKWSQENSEYGVHWDGNLICSAAWNSDGERLSPESGTAQYHTFAVHKELFQGLTFE